MSDSGFYKCACENCQGHLEFPAHAAGITTTCPHCGVETRLVAPEGESTEVAPGAPPPSPAAPPTLPPPPPPPAPLGPSVAPAQAAELKPAASAQAETGSAAAKLKRVLSVVWSVLIGLGIVIGVGWKVWRTVRKTGSVVEAVKSDAKPAAAEPARVSASVPPPTPAAPPTSIVLATGAPPARKAGEDLQVTGFEIHKAKDGNLQYIVGVVTNHSARQYFNVRLEFVLTRAGGKAGDTATDTLRNLPANIGSTFKVNIIGTAPVTGAMLTKVEGEKE